MKKTKSALRKELKQARLALPASERQAASVAITERLLEHIDWSNVQTLHCFETLHELGEIDVSQFMARLEAHYPGVHIYTSRLVDGTWQTVSLQDKKAKPDQLFDVIVVPMLGFDEQLHRIGYGGGYYDRFLSGQLHAQKIGVCFEAGKVQVMPVEPHDIPLDEIITEQHTYRSVTP